MALTLTDDAKKQALASITRFCTDELELEANTVQSTLLLKFFLAELGPTI